MDGAETVESQLHLPIDGETALATPIGDDLALIAGVADAMSDTVEVLLNGDPSMTMRARTISWKRHDAPADIVVAAPAGTDPATYEGTGATWLLYSDWLDAMSELASAPPPGS